MTELTSDWELLVQRFLDQELSAEERVRFIVRLGRDDALRQRVIEMEQLVLNTGRLPRPAVSDRFVARVMEQTAPMQTTWRRDTPTRPLRRLADALWAPRALQWNLATAVAGACLALLVTGGIIYGNLLWRGTSAPQGADRPVVAVAASPSTVLVRLVVVHRDARTVQVAGDFNGWNPARTPLEEVSNGAWTVTIPLEPGRYEYMYVIDGQHWIADPFAAEQNDDGFGSRNAVLDVRPALYTPGAPL